MDRIIWSVSSNRINIQIQISLTELQNRKIPGSRLRYSSKYSAILAIPFMIAFAVQFVNEKEEWVLNGQFEVQLPGDLFLYFSLIMLNFSWAFACIYYR